MRFTVKTFKTSITLDMSSSDTISAMKKAVFDQLGLHPASTIVSIVPRVISPADDDKVTLGDAGVIDGSTVHLITTTADTTPSEAAGPV